VKLPKICIVDVNVGIAANGEADVCAACELTCIEWLQAIMERGLVAIDDGGRIFDEYMTHLRLAGEPNVGDEFIKWVHDNEWQPERCERVPITPTNDGWMFAEFPHDPALANFDRSDRKYVAVAAACAALVGPATILNATDSDWKHHQAALAANGVPVVHLCPDELKD
jgi:hypothetical protein